MKNGSTWLLVADASKARLYSTQKARLFQEQRPEDLKLLNQFTHEDSRKKGIELATDKMGTFGSGVFVETTSPKVREAEQFAHELINHLETGRKQKHFRELILVAPPAFMGMLNKYMSREVHKLLAQTIEKNYTEYNEKDLLQNLMHHL